jgi:chemotaxis protein MotB
MAGDKKQAIVIKKVKGGGGHGHHGGAWKVAFADFMTAMMAFFLVMWLMGSDEETKAAIAHYFNHPNTPYRSGRDPQSDTSNPLGEKKGDGDSLLKGAGAGIPEDLVKEPMRNTQSATAAGLDRIKQNVLDETEGLAYAVELNVDSLKFSVPGDDLFEPDSKVLSAKGKVILDKLGPILRKYEGFLTIEGHTDAGKPTSGESPYEFSLGRAVTTMNHLVKNFNIQEERIFPVGAGGRKSYSTNRTPAGREKNRRIEFTLEKTERW